MRVKLALFVIALFLISSCTYEQPVTDQGKSLIFIVDGTEAEEPKFKIYVVAEENPLAWFDETKQERYHKNLVRSMKDYEDEQDEFEIRARLKNVKRSFDNEDGEQELIIGFDKELDNPDFKEVDY